ncbi:MAG: hypothetical protein U0V56_10410 [Actinomycetota bacterium]
MIGVDTHKYVHVAVALDELGTLLADTAMPADRAGYERLLEWATSRGRSSRSASREPVPMARRSRASFVVRVTRSSRSLGPTGVSDG